MERRSASRRIRRGSPDDHDDDDPDPEDDGHDWAGDGMGIPANGSKDAVRLKFPPVPTASGFRQWRTTVLREIAAGSREPQAAYVWALQIDNRQVTDEQLNRPGRFAALDGKIVSALGGILKAELLRKVNNRVEYEAKHNVFMGGRLTLRVVFTEFATNAEYGSAYAIADLLQVRLTSGTSEEALAAFATNWEWVEVGLGMDVAEEIREAVLWEQLRTCRLLDAEIILYKNHPRGHYYHSYGFLRESLQRHVDRHRQEGAREQIVRSLQNVAGGQAKALVSEESEGGTPATPASGLSADKKQCWRYAKGQPCKFGSQCKFSHSGPVRKSETRGRSSPKGSRASSKASSASSGGGGAMCLSYARNKKCKYGDQCKFRHDVESAPASAYMRAREST
eukprot:4548586-Amphidinium_carterae.1